MIKALNMKLWFQAATGNCWQLHFGSMTAECAVVFDFDSVAESFEELRTLMRA